MMLNLEQTTYLVACIDEPTRKIGIDITELVKLENRLADVATVTIQKAPELLMTFNRAWLDLNRMISILTFEKNKAENLLKRNRAEALLNCTEDTLKAKGHNKGSADLRNAIADTDPSVIEAGDKLDEFKALLSFLQGKQEAFKEGYQSVKKIISVSQLPGQQYGNGGMPEPFSQKPTINNSDSDFDLPEGFRG
jgi:hypothetical protein